MKKSNTQDLSLVLNTFLEKKINLSISNLIKISSLPSQKFDRLKTMPKSLLEKEYKFRKNPFDIIKMEEKLNSLKLARKKKAKEEKEQKLKQEREATQKKQNELAQKDTFFKYF